MVNYKENIFVNNNIFIFHNLSDLNCEYKVSFHSNPNHYRTSTVDATQIFHRNNNKSTDPNLIKMKD